jgi:hypothetical protein
MAKKLHHMYDACRITVKFDGFSFSRDFHENFRENENFRETKIREISQKSSYFRMIFAFSRKLKN